MKKRLLSWRLTAAVFTIVAFFSLFPNHVFAFAGNSQITGTVRDSVSGETLPFASVAIAGTNQGAFTDREGAFRIAGLEAGTYTLNVSYVGYNSREIGVTVARGEIKKLSIVLTSTTVLKEVVVSTQRRGQVAAINQQIKSEAMVNVVSSEKIKELPDLNAAEAVGRTPGVLAVRSGGEANKLSVRGLPAQYTSISINGVSVPGTDANNRSVDLSIISPELLSGVEVFKSPTADMDGEQLGGAVNLVVRGASDDRRTQLTLYGGYNNLKNDLRNYKGALMFNNRFLDKKIGVLASANFERTNRSSQNGTLNKENHASYDDPEFHFTELRFNDKNNIIYRGGANVLVDYRLHNGGNVSYTFIGTGKKTDEFEQIKRVNVARNQMDFDVNDNIDEDILIKHIFSGKYNFNWAEIEGAYSMSNSTANNYYDFSAHFIRSDIKGITGLQDNLIFSNFQELYFREESVAFWDSASTDFSVGKLQDYNWQPDKTKNKNNEMFLNITIPFKAGSDVSGFLKFGGKYNKFDRDRTVTRVKQDRLYVDAFRIDNILNNMPELTTVNTVSATYRDIAMSNFIDPGKASTSIWNGKYEMAPAFSRDFMEKWHSMQASEYVDDKQGWADAYGVTETVSAGYLMAKLKYKELVTFIPGVRYEESDNTYEGYYNDFSPQGDLGGQHLNTAKVNYGVWLPSAHLKIQPKNWLQFRLSTARVLSRPDYNYIIPKVTVNKNDGIVTSIGNPDLKPLKAWQYDVSVSVVSDKIGLITLGGFYKDIDDMFYNAQNEIITTRDRELWGITDPTIIKVQNKYINVPKSKTYGMEFEIQTNFKDAPRPFNGIVLNGNVTYLKSETSYAQFVLGFDTYKLPDGDEYYLVNEAKNHYIYQPGKIVTQADLLSNLSVGYDYKGFSTRVSLIYIAPFQKSVHAYLKPAATDHTDSYFRVDASIKQKFNKNLSLLLNLSNITSENERDYQYQTRLWNTINEYGMTADLGIQFTF